MKFSKEKSTYPYKKQVHRILDTDNKFVKDIISLENEETEGIPLLIPVMKNGNLCYDLPSISEVQRTALENLAHLPEPFKRFTGAETYPILKSQGLETKKKDAEKILRNLNIYT